MWWCLDLLVIISSCILLWVKRWQHSVLGQKNIPQRWACQCGTSSCFNHGFTSNKVPFWIFKNQMIKYSLIIPLSNLQCKRNVFTLDSQVPPVRTISQAHRSARGSTASLRSRRQFPSTPIGVGHYYPSIYYLFYVPTPLCLSKIQL